MAIAKCSPTPAATRNPAPAPLAKARGAKVLTLGQMVDSLNTIRERKRTAEAAVKVIEEEYTALEEQLMEKFAAEGLEKGSGKTATASISSSMKPTVKDWDVFHAYVHKNKAFHLLERRPSVTGCRELFEMKGAIPGVEVFMKKSLLLKSLT